MVFKSPIHHLIFSLFLIAAMLIACDSDQSTEDIVDEETRQALGAEVSEVVVSGSESNYSFTVEVRSPDLGCNQYADWWEVISAEGKLIYRRILAHSHVTEQPFRRAGGPIPIAADSMIIVRAHMNNLGYGTSVMRGSVESGFTKDTLSIDFAQNLSKEPPLPGDCPN
ncbi:MAG: hypothetical protein HKN87_03850 [Saprospiraceae bacterium]|nr:hypothetical protein [Saprospiraceae bacterium]